MGMFENNILFLKKYYPDLLTAVDNDKQLVYEQTTTKNNEPNLIVVKNNISSNLHSKYNAIEEAKKWTLTLSDEQVHSEHLLIIGCGLGYYLEQLLEYSTASNIYVYEPDFRIFNAWLQVRDIRKVLSNRRIRLFVVGEHELLQSQLTKQISVYAKESLYIAVPPVYNKLFETIVRNMHHKVKESLQTQVVNHATLHKNQQGWITNILYNLPYVTISTPASRLCKVGKGMIAIIVGSGPSLKHDIHFLHELKSSCLIIAAGSSIQALEHYGITPHMVVSMDGGIPNFKVFENVDTRQSPLLFCAQINHNILEHYEGSLIWATLSHDSITPNFCENKEMVVFKTSTSVTGTAMQVATYMGVSQIILMGQDLSYPNNQFYSSGVKHVSDEQMADQLSGATEWVPNVDGGRNPTTLPMKTTLDDIELHIQMLSLDGVRIINSSRHGAAITGAEWIPMEKLTQQLSELPIHEFELSNYCNELTVEEKLINLNKLKNELKLIYKQTNDVGRRLKQLFSSMGSLADKAASSNINSISKGLVEIDKLWSQITRKKAFELLYSFSLNHHIGTYMRHVAEIVETEDCRKKAKLIVLHLGALVKAMDEFTPQLLRILEDSIDRLNIFMDELSSKELGDEYVQR